MSGSAAIDSNAYVALCAGDAGAASLVGSFGTLLMPVVVLGELRYGAGASNRLRENTDRVEEFAAKCTLLEITADVARRYSDLRLRLRTAGRPIPDNDLWIAAACLAVGVPLITRDAHFAHVPSLSVLSW